MQLHWRGPSGGRRAEVAIVEDFSARGASLFLGVPVAPMTDVILRASDRSFQGIVRYCVEEPNGYVAGVEFEPESPAAEYLPEHFLDVSRLDFTPEG
jgi:hypothetical protein